MARVSVVLPTYDRPEFLPGAIETVLGQTHEPVDVVVVDDGSPTDYAAETVAQYPDTVRCIAHDEQEGQSAARNTGIEAATGDYVAFLDDDDRWQEEKIARQVEVLERRSDAGMATCLMTSVRPDGDPITCQVAGPSGDLADDILVENVIGSPSRVLVRDAALSDQPFDESLPTKADWDFYIAVCQEWPVALVEDHLYVRTQHSSLSSDPAIAARDNLAVIRKYEDRIRDRGLWTRTMATYHTRVGRRFLGARDRDGARQHLRQALALSATPTRLALLAYTYLPWPAFRSSLRVKRATDAVRCGGIRPDTSARSVPGFPPAAATD